MPKRPQCYESSVRYIIRSRQTDTKNLYKVLILSKIEYGLQAYASASKSQLARLDAIQNTTMRIITRAFKGTSSKSLEVECNLHPLKLKREETALKYGTRSSALINKITEWRTVHDYKMQKLKDRPPYSIKIRELLAEYEMNEIKTQTPTNIQLANIKSINPKSELSKTMNKKRLQSINPKNN